MKHSKGGISMEGTTTFIKESDKKEVEEIQGFLALLNEDEKIRFMSILEGAKVTMLLKANDN